MSYIDQISIACAPYVNRAQNAINFFKVNNNKMSSDEDGGLFLALAHGPDNGWAGDVPELPNLNTYELDNVFKFVRYSKLYFVKSDVDGKINVGNLTWRQISYGSNEDEYFRNVRNAEARWLYVQFDITDDNDIIVEDNTIRQIGIYSQLKLASNFIEKDKTVYLPSEIAKIKDNNDKRYFDGVLTLIQNIETFVADTTRQVYSFVLEF